MKCKPGDLAVVVKTSDPSLGNLGKIVKVIRLASAEEVWDDGVKAMRDNGFVVAPEPIKIRPGPYWLVDQDINNTTEIRTFKGDEMVVHTVKYISNYQFDEYLHPLRGDTKQKDVESVKELCE